MQKQKKKYEYLCEHCCRPFLAYPSTRRGKTIACSKSCASEIRKISSRGVDNNNYRHGIHCEKSYCSCGNEKDYRANKCRGCTTVLVPAEGYDDTDESIIRATKNSNSYFALSKLCGIARSKVKERIESLKLDISHFSLCRDRRTKYEDVFKVHDKRENALVRKYLLDFELLEYKCIVCGQTDEWMGKVLTLQLDHINGNSCDNRFDNLRWLCPNCHTQTSTFCGRNIDRKDK